MKYMLLINYDEQVWSQLPLAERQRVYRDTVQIADGLTSRGRYLTGFPLLPTSATTSVRVREGKRLVTDGPFAETREQLGGFMIIEASDLDEVISIAGSIPLAQMGTIEVRPVREGPPT